MGRLHNLVGYHQERTVARTLPGSAGLEQMSVIMHRLRTRPPTTLAGLPVTTIRDYRRGVGIAASGETWPLSSPRSDLLFFDTALPGNYAVVRPSGTEPKLKYYLFAYRPRSVDNSEQLRAAVQSQLAEMAADLLLVGG
jgi:phosphoglucomutase/phosphomannomutase